MNEQCAATQPRDAFGRGGSCAENGGIAGLNYRNQATWNADWIGAHTWNAAATLRERRQQHQGWIPGRLPRGQSRAGRRHQRSDVSLQQRHPEPVDAAARAVSHVLTRALQRALRAGPVDARATDDDRRAALRPLVELLSRTVDRWTGRAIPAGAVHLGRVEGRHRLQRHHAAHGCGLRPVRHRQDGDQVQRRQIPRGRRQRQRQLLVAASELAHPADAESRVDRLERQLRSRLRSAERRGAEPDRHRRRYLRRLGKPELRQGRGCQRQPDLQPWLRREDPQGLGHAAVRLADRRHAAAGNPAARVGRSRLLAPVAAELHRHRQPERRARPTSISSTWSRHPIHGCPAAAGTRSAGSTTSSPTSSRYRSTTCAPTRRTTGRFRRSTTASISTSTRGCGTASSSRPARRRDNA